MEISAEKLRHKVAAMRSVWARGRLGSQARSGDIHVLERGDEDVAEGDDLARD